VDVPSDHLETVVFLTSFFRSSPVWRAGRVLVRQHGIDPEQCVVSVIAGEDLSESPTGAVCGLFLTDGRRLMVDFSCDQQSGECQAITRMVDDWLLFNPYDHAANWLAQPAQFREFDRLVRVRSQKP
jgi:hypothetical protein